jgi:nitronate monooxygenase
MKLPSLKIGNFTVPIPIIQGGMAIRISTAELAGAVAKEGGIGVIAGTGMSAQELKNEIINAKELAQGRGKIGVNILFAASDFVDLVRQAMVAGIDLVIYGAGFSKDIFKMGKEFNCPIVPIVSSARLAKTSEKLGAAAVVVEGCEAGGHLGTDRSINEILPEVINAVNIPIIAAGGITTGADIYKYIKMGASGVQIATKFAASKESNASEEFKKIYLAAKKDDSILIDSPVGLPGRAIKTFFSEAICNGTAKHLGKCNKCLKRCSRSFCLKDALENAQRGDINKGLVFAGINVDSVKEILSVKEIINRLLTEYEFVSKKYEEVLGCARG